MKGKSLVLVAAMLGMLLSGAPMAQTRAEVALREAMEQETVSGDVKGAIEKYRAIITSHAADRVVVARALVRLGECYQKVGNDQARNTYERVLREYPDQKEAAGSAQAKLARLGSTVPPSGVTIRHVREGEPWSAVSHDGRFVTYTEWPAGELAVRDVVTARDRRLTNFASKNGEYADQAAFSPDGTQIAFSYARSGTGPSNDIFAEGGGRYDLQVVSTVGSASLPRRLYDNQDVAWIAPFDWSPDGKTLAVALTRKDRTSQIGLVSVADGSLRILKTLGAWRTFGKLFFSPDGTWLVFDGPEDSARREHDVFVISIDGANHRPVIVHPSHDIAVGWSLDGRQILFASDRTGALGIYALPIGNGQPGGTPAVVRAGVGMMTPVRITRSGSLYYIVDTGGRSDIHLASVDFERGELTSPVSSIPEFMGANTQPAWAPDGGALAHIRRSSAPREQATTIVVRSPDAQRAVRQLAPALEYVLNPVWSPDGRQFAAGGRDARGRNGVYRIDANTGVATEVALGATEHQWSSDGRRLYVNVNAGGEWLIREHDVHENRINTLVRAAHPLTRLRVSPDGRKLYYRTGIGIVALKSADDAAFVERDLVTGEERTITRGRIGGINVSPDGRWIATATLAPDSSRRGIQLIDISTGQSRELLSGDIEMGIAVWSRDSRSLLIQKVLSADKRAELWWLPIDGRQPKKIHSYAADRDSGFTVSLHPDGRQVAFSAAPLEDSKSDIWVMDSFMPRSSSK